MSKQDIEKRLGFAAQGVKETTRTNAKARFGGHDAFVVTQNYNGSATGTIKGFDSLQQVQAYIKERRAAIAAKATPEEAKTVSWTIYKTIDEAGNSQSVGTVKFARPGVKTSFSNGATTNAFLSKIDAATRNKILTSIAKHYGISASQAMAEVTDADAESLLDYMTEPERSATSVLLKRHGFSRAGAKAAMAKPLRKAEPYEALYYKWFNGIQVSIMDMTKIKNDINAIIASGANPDVEMPKLVKKYASSGFSRPGVKAKFVRIVTTPQGRYTTNLDKNTRAPIEGGKGYVMVDPAMYITPKRVRVQGTKGEIEVQAIVEGKEIVGVSAKLVSARPGAKAKMAKRMVVDTITSGNQKHELGYESVMQPVAAGEPPHEWFRPIVRTTNLDTGKSSEKASQPHYTEKSARDWLKNYASSVKPSTDPLYAEYASNREKISKMMTRLAQARNNPELRQKLQAESDKLDARQREVAAQLQKRKSSRPGAKAEMAAEIASDPRDKDFEKLKTLKGVVHQGKGFYIIPNKLMTPERRTKVKRSTQRYELSNMGDLVGWGTNHPNVNDYRLKDWAEAFA